MQKKHRRLRNKKNPKHYQRDRVTRMRSEQASKSFLDALRNWGRDD